MTKDVLMTTELDIPRPLTTLELEAREEINDGQILHLVRQTRVSLLEQQLKNGLTNLDTDSFEQLHKNLVELDKAAFTNQKLQLEKTNTESIAELAKATAMTITKEMGKGLFTGNATGTIPDPSDFIEGTVDIIEGELSTGDDARSYDKFMAEVGTDISERIRSGELVLADIKE